MRTIARSAALATGLLLLAAACGSDPAPPAAKDAEEMQDAGGRVGDLESLAGAWGKTPGRITYRQSAGGTTSSMTLWWLPPGAWRMDLSGGGAATTTIVTGDVSYFCSAAAGSETCFATEGAADMAAVPFLGVFSDPEALAREIDSSAAGQIERFMDTIAGEEASCFRIAATAQGTAGAAEWCFASDGLLLRYGGDSIDDTGVGAFQLEAIEVSREVSDGDFEPPYPVTEIPADGVMP